MCRQRLLRAAVTSLAGRPACWSRPFPFIFTEPRSTLNIYDIALKSGIDYGGANFLGALNIVGTVSAGPTEFAHAWERRADYVYKIERQGQPTDILHIEFQWGNDRKIALRMMEYFCLISRWVEKQQEQKKFLDFGHIVQKILYEGSDQSALPPPIRFVEQEIRPKVLDIREIDAELLLNGDAGDAIFAILCKGGTSARSLKRITQRLTKLPPEKRRNVFTHLLLLAGLRRMIPQLQQELAAMGVIINVKDIPELREPIDRAKAAGKMEGKLEAIDSVLHENFPGEVPDDLRQFLLPLELPELEEVLRRSVKATSIEEALGDLVPAPPRR